MPPHERADHLAHSEPLLTVQVRGGLVDEIQVGGSLPQGKRQGHPLQLPACGTWELWGEELSTGFWHF